jgi:hypothetical protein
MNDPSFYAVTANRAQQTAQQKTRLNELRILCELAAARDAEALKAWMDSEPGGTESAILRCEFEQATGYAKGLRDAMKLVGA